MITDSQIKSALKAIGEGRRRVELRDEGSRGEGRLALIVRHIGKRTACEWYALYYRDRKRRLTKLGVYPTLSLSEARRRYREEYAPSIMAGIPPQNRFVRAQHQRGSPDVSVSALFAAYVKHLKASGKGTWYQVERILLKRKDNSAEALGADRPAKFVEPQTIVSHLAAIHARGRIGMAHTVRAYIRAAYSFGMRSEHNYTRQDVRGHWGIQINPAAAIPTDTEALRVGERFLELSEFRQFWQWLSRNRQRSGMASALQLMMTTGQRVQEILRINKTNYDRAERLVWWR